VSPTPRARKLYLRRSPFTLFISYGDGRVRFVSHPRDTASLGAQLAEGRSQGAAARPLRNRPVPPRCNTTFISVLRVLSLPPWVHVRQGSFRCAGTLIGRITGPLDISMNKRDTDARLAAGEHMPDGGSSGRSIALDAWRAEPDGLQADSGREPPAIQAKPPAARVYRQQERLRRGSITASVTGRMPGCSSGAGTAPAS
jgi:hypothetical protein